MDKKYFVLAFYCFTDLKEPHQEIAEQLAFLEERDAKARIYISEEGINGQMSAAEEDARAYMAWMHSRPPFENLHFKIHEWHENVFPRLIIRYRRQLVAIDDPWDIEETGIHVEPEDWAQMIDQEKPPLLIDVRNDYEWKIGHFEGAETPACKTFREFRSYAQELRDKIPTDEPIMMCCTGGIRCEVYSAYLKRMGFEKVYQLKGGIINYGQKMGSKHWKGKLFVFDDRMSVPISNETPEIIAECFHCKTATDDYYNCANMDCNFLFLCCQACLEKLHGCCCQECTEGARVRPLEQQNPHKPFRRKAQLA